MIPLFKEHHYPFANCHFFELRIARGCVFNCAYCWLRNYVKGKLTPEYANLFMISKTMRKAWYVLKKSLYQEVLINVCEFCDGVILQNAKLLDFLYKTAKELNKRLGVDYKLLIVTKGCVTRLYEVDMSDVFVYSISVNTEKVVKKYEQRAPRPQIRIDFLHKLLDRGYECRVRIDPIIPESPVEEYVELIRSINAERFTIGCLRRSPKLSRKYYNDVSWFNYCSEHSIWGFSLPREIRELYFKTLINEAIKRGKVGVCKDEVGLRILKEVQDGKNYCNCILGFNKIP